MADTITLEVMRSVATRAAEAGIGESAAASLRSGSRLSPTRVASVLRELESALGPRVTVSRMVPPGIEIAFGIVRDPQFGPLVLVGAGGVLVEIMKDRRLAMPPLDEERARAMIDRLEIRPLLSGVRGRAGANVNALTNAVVALSWLAHDYKNEIAELDLNPMVVLPQGQGAFAVDALLVTR